MTSASELFYQRRSRGGRGNSDLPDYPSSSSSSNRGCQLNYTHRNHNYHGSSRQDVDGCVSPRRSHHSRHSSHRLSPGLERSSVRLEQGSSQFVPANNMNVDSLSSRSDSRSSRPGLMGNERRLPGDVLLARARLLERLRGVSLSETRHTARASFAFHNRRVRIDNPADWAPNISTELYPAPSTLTDSDFLLQSAQQQSNNKKPPGLTPDALDCLHFEIHSAFRNTTEVPPQMQQASLDCSICLESFNEGDRLIRLPCHHRFHSTCLNPWIQTCGDCPYCRRDIIVTGPLKQ